jgi:hypothetical protein
VRIVWARQEVCIGVERFGEVWSHPVRQSRYGMESSGNESFGKESFGKAVKERPGYFLEGLGSERLGQAVADGFV